MTHKQKIDALRQKMQANNIDAFIVYNADPHMSEYLPKNWQERKWLSGFSGSAGFVVVTKDKAGLWTDSRYFVQAPMELEGSGIDLYKQGTDDPDYISWLSTELPSGSTVALNTLTSSHSDWEKLEKKLNQKNIKLIDKPLLSEIWKDREPIASDSIFVHPLKYAGQSVEDKLQAIRKEMDKKGVSLHIITALDDVAWTTNLRGNDVACNPVFLGYMIIGKEQATLYVDLNKVTDEVKNHLQKAKVELKDYGSFYNDLKEIKNQKVLISPTSNQKIFKTLEEDNKFLVAPAPGNLLKAIKNESELEGFRKVMVRDGVALVKFFYWLKQNVGKQKMDEYTVGERLEKFRAEGENFVGISFSSIIGFKGNGAVVHYSAKKETAKEITAESSILIDSGGQYLEGTTDITRTLPLGEVSDEYKRDWTLVLKGMIDLSLAKFPKGTRGTHLDAIARFPLWKHSMNYGHGTGHGVGSFMNVHEGPQNIRTDLNDTPLIPGMVLSNEPGLYRENQYGIRIENLVAVKKEDTSEFGDFYTFETLTLCPIFNESLCVDMLTPEEKKWLNEYHSHVKEALEPYLEGDEKAFLEKECQPV